jgi:hypothetical protein
MASTAYYNFTGLTTTVAPTTAQALGFNSLPVTAFFGDTDTTLTVTHNWGVSVTAYTTLLQPWLIWSAQQTAAVTVTLAVVGYTANAITVNKNSQTSSGGLFTLLLQRPFSEIS